MDFLNEKIHLNPSLIRMTSWELEPLKIINGQHVLSGSSECLEYTSNRLIIMIRGYVRILKGKLTSVKFNCEVGKIT